MVTWVVQNAIFGDEFGYDSFIASIDASNNRRIQLDYVFWESTIDLKLTGITNTKEILPFGTRSFISYAKKNNWNVFWDDTFDYPSLCILGDDFINYDLQVAPLENLKASADGKIFLREAAGFNIIKGKVISSYALQDWIKGFKSVNCHDNVSPRHHDWHPIDGNTPFIIAPVKKIINEYRVWIIAKKAVSSSQYIANGEIIYSNADENLEVMYYAQSIAEKIPWAMDNFVLDIFQTEQGLKVGEINCLHCSGWYAVNSAKIVKALLAALTTQ